MARFENDLTTGSVGKKLLYFSVPFFLSNLVQSIYSAADTVIVSYFGGTNSVSAVSVSSMIIMILTNIAAGISTGGTVMLGQHLGAGRREKLTHVISTLFVVLFIVSAAMTSVLWLFIHPILRLLNTPPEAYTEAYQYLLISLIGIVFIFGYNAVSAVMRGLGDSKTPMVFVVTACIVNVVLDLILVGVFDMGAMGAAAATVFSQGLSMLLCIVYLKKNDFIFDFKPKSFKFYKSEFRGLMITGLPNAMMLAVTNISFLVLGGMVNKVGGVTASAATGIVGKFNGFAILPESAMGASSAAVISQNMGAGHEKRAKDSVKYCIIFNIFISIVVLAVSQLCPNVIFALFNAENDVTEAGMLYIRSFSIEYVFLPLIMAVNSMFNGTGNGWASMVTDLISSVLVRVPAAILYAKVLDMGLFGIGLAIPTATLVGTTVACIFYKIGIWKKLRI